MGSIARWVLPVLVGPSTAVTPVPRTPVPRLLGREKEIAINLDLLSGPQRRYRFGSSGTRAGHAVVTPISQGRVLPDGKNCGPAAACRITPRFPDFTRGLWFGGTSPERIASESLTPSFQGSFSATCCSARRNNPKIM